MRLARYAFSGDYDVGCSVSGRCACMQPMIGLRQQPVYIRSALPAVCECLEDCGPACCFRDAFWLVFVTPHAG